MTAMIMHNPTAMPLRPEASGFWRNSLAASLALALHAGVLVALVLGWSVDKPQVEAPAVLTTQLVMLAPPAAPAEPLPALAEVAPPPPPLPAAAPEPVRPRVDPQVLAQKLEQAALARKRVEDKKREQLQEQQRQQRERLEAEQRQRDTEQRVAQEQAQAQRAEQSRLAAERARRQAAQAADSRQYQPLSKEAPDYPQRALDKNLEGDCTVEYSVNPQGRVENPRVIDGCHPLFMRPSLAAVATFRYQPRLIDGQAVTVPAVRNTFHYRIQ